MRRPGFTLIEIVIVLVILIVLAGLIVPVVDGLADRSKDTATRASLERSREVLMSRYWPEMNGVFAGVSGYPQPNPAAPNGRNLHPQLHFLFVNPGASYDPVTRRGWSGPYLQDGSARYPGAAVEDPASLASFTNADYGLTGDVMVPDGWGRPIVIQLPTAGTAEQNAQHARLISAGPDGVISTPAGPFFPNKSDCGDDIVLYLRTADLRP